MVTAGKRSRSWRNPFIGGVFTASLFLAVMGCNRAQYRCQADKEVYGAVACATSDPRWVMDDYTIQPDPASRMYDPNNDDCPPMPPDDPESHLLMHCVDGKKGWKHWHRYGDTPYVENPIWRAYLPRDSDGVVAMDRQGAIQLALLHSREYQSELENLYLSALDVTFQRFRFDTQFFGGTQTDYRTDGPLRAGGMQNVLSHENDLRAQRLFATGAELIVGLANSFVWQFSGPDKYQANTLLSYSLVQPLLRAGGRAVVLEGLTDAERAMLANVRQMEQYRRGFFSQIVAGRGTGPGPSQSGLGISSLAPPSPAALGGFLGLLGDQIRIRNQKVNVTVVHTNLDQLQAFFEAGRLTRLQVEQARQALLDAQSQLIVLEADYEDRLDVFKILLGLPPDLAVRVADPLVDRFNLIAPTTSETSEAVSRLLAKIRQKQEPLPADLAAELEGIRQRVLAQVDVVQQDLATLKTALPERRRNLDLLSNREEVRTGKVDPSAFGIEGPTDRESLRRRTLTQLALNQREALLAYQFPELVEGIRATLSELGRVDLSRAAPPAKDALKRPQGDVEDPVRQRLTALVDRLSDQMLQLTLIQAPARLDAISLTWVDMAPEGAFRTARANRPDWMNARAALVDTWRQIEVTANALKSDLNLTVSGDVNTVGNNPVKFRGSTGELRVGVQFDAPLTRVAERNAYRSTLIAYQQARRDYYVFEDRINQILRSELRDIRVNQLDFELRRAAVFVAIAQLELTRLTLQKPPKAGETSEFGATTARDLLQASSALLSAQNAFLTGWLNYEIQRLNLDFDLGTMRLDENGMWIDPGPIQPDDTASEEALDDHSEVAPSPPAPLRSG
jgi:outer membrane protein TolC